MDLSRFGVKIERNGIVNMLLNENDVIFTVVLHHKIVVGKLLGAGGQGEVYSAWLSGKKVAIKVYHSYPSKKFRDNLLNNIHVGSPSPSFLWPVECFDDGHLFGYVMPLLDSSFRSFVSYLNGEDDFSNGFLKIDWLIAVCQSFQMLHRCGLSYLDLNDGSLFLNPKDGELRICDTDNIVANKKELGVMGKPKYMAPELVIGKIDPQSGKRQMPDVYTDRWSLAVILFMTLCKGDPFCGMHLADYEVFDDKAWKDIYGRKPVFVFSDKDTSNHPIHGFHTAPLILWPTLPLYIQKAFRRVFGVGILDRENGRLNELEWIELLCRLRNEMVTCKHCGDQFSFFVASFSNGDRCPFCNHDLERKWILSIGRQEIYLEEGKKVYKSNLEIHSEDFLKPIGIVVSARNDPSRLGIRILDDISVRIQDPEGNEAKIVWNQVIPLIRHLKLYFEDGSVGEIN